MEQEPKRPKLNIEEVLAGYRAERLAENERWQHMSNEERERELARERRFNARMGRVAPDFEIYR